MRTVELKSLERAVSWFSRRLHLQPHVSTSSVRHLPSHHNHQFHQSINASYPSPTAIPTPFPGSTQQLDNPPNPRPSFPYHKEPPHSHNPTQKKTHIPSTFATTNPPSPHLTPPPPPAFPHHKPKPFQHQDHSTRKNLRITRTCYNNAPTRTQASATESSQPAKPDINTNYSIELYINTPEDVQLKLIMTRLIAILSWCRQKYHEYNSRIGIHEHLANMKPKAD